MPTYRAKFGTIILFLCDIVILFLITTIAITLRDILPSLISSYPVFTRQISYAWWFFPVWLMILAYEGAYTRRFTFWDEVKMLWKVSLFSTLAILSIVFVGKTGGSVSRTVVVLIGSIAIALFPIARTFIKRRLIAIGLLKRKVVILGANEMGVLAYKALHGDPNLGYEVVGFIDDAPHSAASCIEGVKVHRRTDKIERYLSRTDIHDVVIALPDRGGRELHRLVTRLQHKAGSVLYFPDYAGMAVIGTDLRHFFNTQTFALEIKNNLSDPLNNLTKRSFDLVVGGVLFSILLLPLLCIALLIRLSSPGPAIYRHLRTGKHCRPFPCFKFRTMYQDADARLQDILASDGRARAEWERFRKLSHDPRVTLVGRFLRRTSLDELPQLLNVIRGEMSLVGPRPVTQEEIDQYYRENADLCFSVLPGITGLWQVSGRSDTSYDHRITLDSWYVRNWNLWIDMVILLKTLRVLFKREGAR